MKMLKLCYVATPYRGPNELIIEQNIMNGRFAAVQLMMHTEFYPVSPVLNTAGFHRYEDICRKDDRYWLLGAMSVLNECVAIYLAPGWESSSGCINEIWFVLNNMIAIQKKNVAILINEDEGTGPIIEVSQETIKDILKRIDK